MAKTRVKARTRTSSGSRANKIKEPARKKGGQKRSKAVPSQHASPSKTTNAKAVVEIGGHRIYRLPTDFLGEWTLYDATANVGFADAEGLAEHISVEEDEIEEVFDQLPIAKAGSRSIRPRVINSMNNAGFDVHFVYDPGARHGYYAIKCIAVSDLDMEEACANVSWSDLQKEAVGKAKEMQSASDSDW